MNKTVDATLTAFPVRALWSGKAEEEHERRTSLMSRLRSPWLMGDSGFYAVNAAVLLAVAHLLVGCSAVNSHFSFGVNNRTNQELTNITVVFSGDGGRWPIGAVGVAAVKSVSMLPGRLTADLSWTDAAGKTYSQHVQITPLPAPTNTFYGGGGDRDVYFVITPEEQIQMMYHDPRFQQ